MPKLPEFLGKKKTSKKQPTVVKIAVIGSLSEKGDKPDNSYRIPVLMRNLFHQDEQNLPSHEQSYFCVADIPLKKIQLSVVQANGLQSASEYQTICNNANTIVVCYDDFDEERIKRQLTSIPEAASKNAHIIILGLRQKDEFLEHKGETTLSGEQQARQFAERNKYTHQVVQLNNTASVSDFFFNEFGAQLQQQGLSEDDCDDAKAVIKDSISQGLGNSRAYT